MVTSKTVSLRAVIDRPESILLTLVIDLHGLLHEIEKSSVLFSRIARDHRMYVSSRTTREVSKPRRKLYYPRPRRREENSVFFHDRWAKEYRGSNMKESGAEEARQVSSEQTDNIILRRFVAPKGQRTLML